MRRLVAAGATATPVWRNERGGLTYRVQETAPAGTGTTGFLKWAPHGSGLDLAAEAARLAWARPHAAVPEVLARGEDADGTWLRTAALTGTSAVDARWRRDPARAAAGVGAGLRALHDALPVAGCPFTWSLEDRVAAARARLAAGDGPAAWAPEHAALGPAEVLARLADPPPVDPVVCQGDACTPNALLGDDGAATGHVDLGRLGVADRWADLAVAAWSFTWNHGPGYEHLVVAAYGVTPDPRRNAFYRLLWDVS
ncbi:phosphotransferase [Cellulomonas marina]|uniref:phosphotransferase n=1 Tax=Cellulomonas marina TaxID=988821 RepID=UPI000B7FA247|nr:phosphotransferase [Cellulomonas marina]GIG30254.1 aminoglycoside phosphotransferase APH(3') [Cellulomonas marina]